jgi:hypothetical protein
MKINRLITLIIGIVFFTLTITANAAVVRFTEANYDETLGTSFTAELIGESFTVEPDAGAFSLIWDSTILAYVGTTIASPPWDSPFIFDESDAANGALDFVFLTKDDGRAGSNFNIASFEFNVIGIGMTTLGLADVFGGLWGSEGVQIDVDTYTYGVSNVNVISAVPVPAAVWMMGSGLVALFGATRRKN